MKIKNLLILIITVLSVLCIGSVYAETDTLYPVDEWYFIDDFDDKSVDLSKKYTAVGTLPSLGVYDNTSVAVFDPENITSGSRMGFNILKTTDENYIKMTEAFEAGEELCFEFRANFQDIDRLGLNENFFNALFLIRYIDNNIYFGDTRLDPYTNISNGWHKFSVMIYMDKDGAIKVKNVKVDNIFYKIDTMKNKTTLENFYNRLGWIYIDRYVSSGIGTTESKSKMYLDYVKIYKPKDYDDILMLNRFYSSKMSGYSSYNTYREDWLDSLLETGEFSDLTYTYEENAVDETVRDVREDRYEHIYRLKGMAAEYTVSGRTHYKNQEFLTKLEKAIDFYVTSKFDRTGNTGNWSNALECPTILADVFLMLRESGYTLPENWITISKSHYFDFHTRVGYATGNNGAYEFAMNTSNLPITCGLWRVLAVLFNDITYVEKIYDSLAVSMTDHTDENGNGVIANDVNTGVPDGVTGISYFGDGFYPDGTYMGHGPLQYSFGYGKQYLEGCGSFVQAAAGTKYQFSKEELEVLAGILLDNMRWVTRGDNADFNALGRHTNSPDSNGKITNTIRTKLTFLSNYLLSEPDMPRYDELLQLKSDIEEDIAVNKNGNTSKNYVTGNKYFWNSDLMAHHRDNYSSILKMSSTRTLKTERVSDDGNNNYYLATGTLSVMLTGHEYEKAMAVWDWDRIPGITALNKEEDVPEIPSNSNRSYGSHSFVGGVSDGNYGAAAMDYSDNLKPKTFEEYENPSAPIVEAKKSWFFFDDEIVALGTDISSTDTENNLLTNLEQSILNGNVTYNDASGKAVLTEESTYSSDGIRWVQHGNIGYVFPELQSVTVSNKAQTGNARRKGDTSYPYYTENIFSLYIDHGKGVTDGSYSYIVVPGKSVDDIESYAADSPVNILRNDENIQAVFHKNLRIAQIVFRTAGSLNVYGYTVSVDKPCVVMIDFSGESIKTYVQNPLNTSIDVAVNFKHGDVECGTLNFKTKNGLYAGQTVAEFIEKADLPENEVLYPVLNWYLNEDFDEENLDISQKYVNVQGNPMPSAGVYDDTSVAVFDAEVMRMNGKSRLGFSIFKDSDGFYQKFKNDFENGEEICLEFRANFQDDGLGCNELFFNDLFYIRYLENRTEFAGKNIKYPIANGWHKFSVVVYADDEGIIRYKNLKVDDTLFEGDIFGTSRDTFEKFYYRLGWFYITNYVSSSVNNTKTSSKMYLDYIRLYSIKADTFTDDNGNKVQAAKDVTKVNLNKSAVKDGSMIIVGFYNADNVLTGSNVFNINIEEEGTVIEKPLTKPDNYSDIRVFVFESKETIKPLTESVLFSDTI